MNESYKPSEEFMVTTEGARAAFLELREKAEGRQDLDFLRKLKELNPDANIYLVGGIVRDAAMGLRSSDFDFVLSDTDPDSLEEFLNQNGQIVATTDRQTAVYKFLPTGSDEVYDLALARREEYIESEGRKPKVETEGITIEDDLSRRDLTINAMALPVFGSGEDVIDPFGGIEDIKGHIVQAVGNPRERFNEDPLRMLRVIRFACRFGFDIEETTFSTIQQLKDRLNSVYTSQEGNTKAVVSNERISKEIIGSIMANPVRFLELYDKSGLLEKVLPEVAGLHGVEQPKKFHSEGDAYVHTRLALSNLPADSSKELRLAALFHDIGKKDTFKSAGETGDRIRFSGHEDLSAEMTEEIMDRYRFPADVRDKVVYLVKNHMKILHDFMKMRLSKQKVEVEKPDFDDLIKLVVADNAASIRPDGKPDFDFIKQFLIQVDIVRDKIRDEEAKEVPKQIIRGDEILALAKEIKPGYNHKTQGRVIGRVLTIINERYRDEEIANYEEAVDMAKRLLEDELLN